MKRTSKSLMGEDVAFAAGNPAPMVSIIGSGQHGFVHDPGTALSNSAYVSKPLVCIVLSGPRGFRDLPNPDTYFGTLKELMEDCSRTITGLRATLNVEFTSNQIGHGNEVQEDIAKVTRERSVPVHTFTERYGKPINRFFSAWIEYLLGSGDNSVPKVATLGLTDGPADLLPDYTSATCLYVEPDALHQKVVEAWLVTNMHPKTAGQVEGNRDLSTPGASVDYSIEFTSISSYGPAIREMAQSIWDSINLVGANTGNREAFITDISEDIASVDSAGYKSGVDRLVDEQI